MTPVVGTRPTLEVADIIRQHGAVFLDRHAAGLTAAQRQTLRDLGRCRTAALGGHLQRCGDCGHEQPAYNSCRNRHCPKCQALARAVWLEREATLLLPVAYHHVVFTLPPAVAALARTQPALLYEVLFQTAAATLREVAAHPKHLGAQLGVLMVLHTWGQTLQHHPHIHCVATGGGLACNARGEVEEEPRWRACRPGFFLPVRVLGRLFRGKFLAWLRQAFASGQLAGWTDSAAFTRWLTPLYGTDWVVYAKPPFGGPERVLKYLARYTHRVAISNHRLVQLADGQVTFRYQDYADDSRRKTMTLSAEEFLRRFVQHVLPKGFVKVRHYGLLANRHREQKLAACRRLLLVEAVAARQAAGEADEAESPVIGPARVRCCPHCGSRRLILVRVAQGESDAASGNTS
ncbi:MAG TPA: IS91 family transposase [Gemmataceae bacterium]|nr:IS91 family transposase [Gemmataceae bacterium]